MTTPNSAQVVVEPLASGALIIKLGASSERKVSLNFERLRSLMAAIQKVAATPPKRLIITGSSEEMFTVGADINAIKSVDDPKIGEQLAREGQELYQMIAELPFPTIAAISGPCVGGGCELALACKFRIISDHRSSIIGLPETKLGIIPGFGGTVRLPKLVGLPKALDIILAGKTLRPREALKCGLVDGVVPTNELLTQAEQMDLGQAVINNRKKRVKFIDKIVTNLSPLRSFLKKKVLDDLHKQTKGFYPAPKAAANSCFFAMDNPIEAALKYEARELGQMIITPESKSLVHIFLLSETSKSLGKIGKRSLENLHAIVVGAGAMGAGIAGSMAKADCTVTLKDTTDAALKRGLDQIRSNLSKSRSLSDQEKSYILNRIEATTKDPTNPGNTGLVIEAIFEELEVKKKVLGELAKIVPDDAILATNTSSLSVDAIAAALPNPQRVVGMHFFNPVDKMPLVEVVQASHTDDRTLALVCALTVQLGKFPIVVRDVAGFLVNRILGPYLNETSWLLSEGFTPTQIDRVATEFGMPMGPVRLLDKVGLDVAAHASESLKAAYPDRMDAPNVAAQAAKQGRLGEKSGGGFYIYESPATKGGRNSVRENPELGKLIGTTFRPPESVDSKELFDRLIFSLINEAMRCLDEGVAGLPGSEAAGQIDLGSVMGFGFPPFRGGIIRYAQQLGPHKVSDRLTELSKKYGARFNPAPGIVKRANAGKSFYEKI